MVCTETCYLPILQDEPGRLRLQECESSLVFRNGELLGMHEVWWLHGSAGVAWLSSRVGLQYAMLIVPTCYAASGIAFLNAERIMETDASSAAAAMKRQSSRKELGHAVPLSVTET